MQKKTVDRKFMEDLLRRIREGLIEGVRQEVERRRKLGLPLVVGKDGGGVEIIWPDESAGRDAEEQVG